MGVAVGFICWTLLAAPEDPDVDAAVERVLAADRYQTELPRERAREAPAPGPERRPQGRDEGIRREPLDGDALRPVGSALLWIFAAAFAIAVALSLAREIKERRRARAAIGAPATSAGTLVTAPVARVPDHEALARAGRFADAIHAILLAVLGAIGRAHAGMRPAWTSREILGLVKLEEKALGALRSLVGLVEVTRFGGAPAREEEYRQALSWSGSIGYGESR